MKNLLAFVFLLMLSVSCTSDDEILINEDPLLGTWQLVEQLFDPGDGSGTFQSVDSEKIVEFLDMGSIYSNGSLCNMGGAANEETTATYDTTEQLILVEGCGDNILEIRYQLFEEDLILSYFCIEPCAQKFRKIE